MSAAGRATASGVVLGLVVVFLGQQFGYLDFTQFVPALVELVVGAIIGGIVFGIVGIWIGRRVRRKMSSAPKEWTPAEGSAESVNPPTDQT